MTKSLAVMVVLLGSMPALAKPTAPPPSVPLTRLVANTRAALKAHPDDAHAHYVLGRLLTLQYAGTQQAEARSATSGVPELAWDAPNHQRVAADADRKLLEQAISELHRSAALDPKDARCQLALGWAELELAQRSGEASSRAAGLDAYRRALELGKPGDPHAGRFGSEIDAEAARSLLEALKAHPDMAKVGEVASLESYLAEVDKAPRVMSPIVVLLDGSRTLAPRIDAHAARHFDLDAMHENRAWPWPEPAAGILVWDPERRSRITSGEQLFGNVSWWCFWRDGYEPLAALDDDGDGALTGRELSGVRIWIDRNQDAVSDPGEVVDLAELAIVRISVRSTGVREGVPSNLEGVTLRDGSTLATFDWTPTSLEPSRLSAR